MPRPSQPNRLRRLGLWLLVWLVLSNLLLEWSGLHLWQPVSFPRKTAQVAALWAAEPPPDAVFIGSSLTRNGFAPAVMNEVLRQEAGMEASTHNLGVDGTHAVMAGSLARALLRRRPPRLLIYVVSLHAFHAKYYHPVSANRHLQYFASPWEVISAPAPGAKAYGQLEARLVALFRPMQLPFQWALRTTSGYPKALAGARETRGWRRVDRRRSHALRWERRQTPDVRLVPEAWAALEEMAHRAERRGVEFAVVNLPLDLDRPRMRTSAKPVAEFAGILARFCAEREIPCYNLEAGEVGLLPADYDQDGGHLLSAGAVKLSRHVARRIVAPTLRTAGAGEAEGSRPETR